MTSFLFRFNKKKISVRLLEHNRDVDNETVHIDRNIKRIIKHPGYSDRTFNNDIAILQLDEDLELEGSPGLRPVCLPPTSKSYILYFSTPVNINLFAFF